MRFWLVVIAMLALAQTASADQRYAVVIGANPGWSSDRPLRYAENDAERVRDVLVSLGDFAPDRVALLRDPDTNEVRATLRDLARTVQASSDETLVFFYYSGHADNERLHLRGDPLTFTELQQTLRSMPSTIKLAVIDACKSGAVTRKGGQRVDEFEVSVDNPKLSGMVLLTSSGADELSQESRALAGSVFTHHLVSGLRGAADEDNDKKVTVSEAYHYAYARTRADTATTGTPQRPSFKYELSGQGELVLANLEKGRTARMTVPRGDGTKYVVLDEHEWRLIAEARSDKGRDIDIALPPGNYTIKKVLPDHLEVGSLAVSIGKAALVEAVKFTTAPLAQGILKGNPDELTPEERRDYQRGQAYGLLAQGQANAALNLFDGLLRESPGDILAWRGRARALVRIAEAYQRVNDHLRERLTLDDALKADPSLTQDPMFAVWYQHLGELDARAQATFEAKQKIQRDIKQNPRTTKNIGIGFDLLSARGMFTVNATMVLKRMLFPRLAVDIAGAGVDAGIVLAPYPSRWSPFLGLGGHMSFRKMGIDLGGGGTVMTTTNGEETSYSTEEMFGLHARAEIGAQFVGRSGFMTELGFAIMMFRDKDGKRVQQGWPIFHFAWVW